MATTPADMEPVVAESPKSDLTADVRFRVTPELKKRWDEIRDARKVNQQDAANALFAWIVDEDPLTQAMIFGQVPVTDRADLTKLVLRRLAASAAPKPRKPPAP